MRAPPGYLKAGDEGKILRLRRSLPGLKQAGFEWTEELAGVFAKISFTRSQVNQAVFYKCVISHTFVLLIRSSGHQIRSDPIHRSVPDPLR